MDSMSWRQLSPDSRRALQFAQAVALERAPTGLDPSSIQVDSWDVLLGILLARPGNSEAEKFFSHFGLVAGQALPDGFPELRPDNLNHNLATISGQDSIQTEPDVEKVLEQAFELGLSSEDDDVDKVRALWAALLVTDNPTKIVLSDLLASKGVDLSSLASATLDWVKSSSNGDYQEFLNSYSPTLANYINYKSDQNFRDAEPSDYVGISAEVDAFAYLLASHNLQPPLAVGLFGNWGSGKTFFMDAIRRRIEQLTTNEEVTRRRQSEVPFWKRIVQIEFNAWHYVEGDLWSSLVEHIFHQLNLASEGETDDTVLQRQRYLLDQFESTSRAVAKLNEDKARISERLRIHRNGVSQLESKRDRENERLKQDLAAPVASQPLALAQDTLISTLKQLGVGVNLVDEAESAILTFGEALEVLEAARDEGGRGRILLRPLVSTWQGLSTVVLGLIGVPLVVWGLGALSGSAVASAFGGVSSALAITVGVAGVATRWARRRLDQIEIERRKVKSQLQLKTQEWQARVEESKRLVAQIERQLEESKVKEDELNRELDEVQRKLEMGPSEILNQFLREVVGAGEYRERLGVPALIRRDFGKLADLISHQNRYLLDTRSGDSGPPSANIPTLPEGDSRIINRIILYIDDLDRCPEHKVIEVLQAVHLLLAFPLFVVVVAVDARWLAHALQTRYPALASGRSDNGQAGPADYLEKIFQIPFWVHPLNDPGRRNIVRGLLGAHVQTQTSTSAVDGNEDLVRVNDDEARVLREMVSPRAAPPLLMAEALTLTNEELRFLYSLAPVMGETPRSVKRFVNVYQLVKILSRAQSRTHEGNPPDEYVAAFLLAIAEGLPSLASKLIEILRARIDHRSLSEFLQDGQGGALKEEQKRLTDWLAGDSVWADLPLGRLADSIGDVERFLFKVSDSNGGTAPVIRPKLIHVIQGQ